MGELSKSADHSAVSVIAPTTADASLAAAIVESCSEAIISTSLDGHIIWWNPAAAQLSGYTADEILGQHWQFLVPPDDVKEVARAVRQFRTWEKNLRIETHLRRKNGEQLQTLLSISAIRDRTGTLVGFSGMFRDITEDKLAEDKLRQSEEKFKTVFKYSSDSISITSLSEGRYLDVNDEFCRMLRLPPEKIVGRTAVQLGILDEVQMNGFASVLRQSGSLRNHEITLADHDGVAHRLLVSAVVVEVDAVRCALGFIKEITDLRRAED